MAMHVRCIIHACIPGRDAGPPEHIKLNSSALVTFIAFYCFPVFYTALLYFMLLSLAQR